MVFFRQMITLHRENATVAFLAGILGKIVQLNTIVPVFREHLSRRP